MDETFDGNAHLRLHQQNYRFIHHLLARMTYYIEQECGVESSFVAYTSRSIKRPFEIEHLWADKYARYEDEFSHPQDFATYRNRIGGLVLLPRGFNQSLGDKPYEQKLDQYFGQNYLLKSLSPKCYQNNPSFLSFIALTGLPLAPHTAFRKVDLDARQDLYRELCKKVWCPSRFDSELQHPVYSERDLA